MACLRGQPPGIRNPARRDRPASRGQTLAVGSDSRFRKAEPKDKKTDRGDESAAQQGRIALSAHRASGASAAGWQVFNLASATAPQRHSGAWAGGFFGLGEAGPLP
jgi:hypothetical protein